MVVVERVGVAGQHSENVAQIHLLAVQLVDQAAAYLLPAQNVLHGLLHHLNIAYGHRRGRPEQQDHQGDARGHYPEDVLVRDPAGQHRVFSIAQALHPTPPFLRRVKCNLKRKPE